MDAVMLLENEKNWSNVTGCIILDKVHDHAAFREHVLKVTAQVSRMRHKLIKIGGWWYFKRMTATEWKERERHFLPVYENITSEQELCKFLSQWTTIRDPLG